MGLGLLAGLVALVVIGNILYAQNESYKNRGIKINDHKVVLHVADDPESRQRGLSGREFLCDYCGMLFEFEHPDYYGFWMPDMHFDIDIVWLQNGTVVHIEEGVSHKTPEIIYKPSTPANQVLEFETGKVDALGVHIGDMINL